MKETPLPLIVRATSGLRPVLDLAERGERRAELLEGVPVARHHVPAERSESLLELADRDDLVGRLVRLQLVPVDDDGEAGEPFVRRRLQPFVVLALLQLAVAEHDDDSTASTEMPLRPRDPATLRDPHPERARVRLDPRHADVRVAVETTEPTQSREALARDDAERVERRVQARHVVPLRREVDVTVGGVPADGAVFSSSNRRNATTSIALNVEPRWPEPARLTATSAFSRQASARSASRSSAARSAARIRSSSVFGTKLRSGIPRRYPGRCGVTTSERSASPRSSSVFSHRKSASLEPGR